MGLLNKLLGRTDDDRVIAAIHKEGGQYLKNRRGGVDRPTDTEERMAYYLEDPADFQELRRRMVVNFSAFVVARLRSNPNLPVSEICEYLKNQKASEIRTVIESFVRDCKEEPKKIGRIFYASLENSLVTEVAVHSKILVQLGRIPGIE